MLMTLSHYFCSYFNVHLLVVLNTVNLPPTQIRVQVNITTFQTRKIRLCAVSFLRYSERET
jgi:hypothetical protein